MKIETKYNVGDDVFFLHTTTTTATHIRRGRVQSISMANGDIFYKVADVYSDTVLGRIREHNEDVLFASPEDVCKHLMSNIVMSPAA